MQGKVSRVWSRPGPAEAKQPQAITLPPPCFTVGMMFFFVECGISFTPEVTGPMSSKKFYLWLISPQNITPKVLFFGKWETSFCVLFWSAVICALQLFHGYHFCPTSFLVNCVQRTWHCGTSRMSQWYILSEMLVGQPLLGRFTTVPRFLLLWIMALTVVCWGPRALAMSL